MAESRSEDTGGKISSLSAAAAARRTGRRRRLGNCPRCGRAVTVDEEFIRLYRNVWHLECALESGPPGRGPMSL